MKTLSLRLLNRILAVWLVTFALSGIQTSQAQAPPPTLAFASDAAGRFQIYQIQTQPLGLPIPITSAGSGNQQSRSPDWSRQGKIAYQFGASAAHGIHVVNPDGTGDIRVTFGIGDEINPSWSPDGQSIVYAALVGPDYDLWIHHFADPFNGTPDEDYPFLDLGDMQHHTQETRPAWSPDGTRIAFVTTANGGDNEIAVVDLIQDNAHPGRFVFGTATFLTSNSFSDLDPAWSPDSQHIVFSSNRTGGRDIYRMSAQFGEGDPANFIQLTTNSVADNNPTWSPDGRLIAFSSDLSGTRQIYVMSAVSGERDTNNFVRFTNDSGTDDDPVWNPIVAFTLPSLNISVMLISPVRSGDPRFTGEGIVTVKNGLGQPVDGATISIFGPFGQTNDAMGNPRFVNLHLSVAPGSSGLTDVNGSLHFYGVEDTLIPNDSSVDFAFLASAIISGQAVTASAAQTINVRGSTGSIGPHPIPQPPIPPNVRIPLGANPWAAIQKARFSQLASIQIAEGTRELAVGIGLLPFFGGLELLFAEVDAAWALWAEVAVGVGVGSYEIYELSKGAAYMLNAQKLAALAADPFDPNFTTVALPQLRQPMQLTSVGIISPRTAALMNDSLASSAIVESYYTALDTSVNRYFTALAAGDMESATLQRNAILSYGDALTPLLEKDGDLTSALLGSFQADGVPNINVTAVDFLAVQNELATHGIPSAGLQILQALNFTATEIQTIQDMIISTQPNQVVADVFSIFQADSDAAHASAAVFNEPPIAIDQRIATLVNRLVVVTLTASDPEANPLSFSIVSNSANGSVAGTPPDLTYTPNPGFTGMDSFTFTASDGMAISGVATITITVTGSLPPAITCPSDVAVSNDPSQCSAVVNYPAPITTGNGVTVLCNPPSGSAFPVGTTAVICTETDSANLTATCSFNVTVNDTQPPVINCPPDIVVAAALGQCSSNVVFSVTANDNCGLASATNVPPSGTAFPIGTTTVISTATDASGNVSTCSFAVTVQDTQPPVISCPADITVTAASGASSALVNFTVTATDNCPGVSVVSNPSSGSAFPIGMTTVNCTATDAAGLTASCSFTVTVNASGSGPLTLSCPADMVAGNDPGKCSAIVNYPAPVASGGSGNVNVVCTPPSGSNFPVGTTTVNCTATDAAGNTATCGFKVTLNDTEPPKASCAVVKAAVLLRNPPRIVGWFQLLATDNCDPDPLIYIKGSAGGFVAGPFHNGDQVEIGHGPSLIPRQAPSTFGGNIATVQLNGDALLWAVDSSRNASTPIKCK